MARCVPRPRPRAEHPRRPRLRARFSRGDPDRAHARLPGVPRCQHVRRDRRVLHPSAPGPRRLGVGRWHPSVPQRDLPLRRRRLLLLRGAAARQGRRGPSPAVREPARDVRRHPPAHRHQHRARPRPHARHDAHRRLRRHATGGNGSATSSTARFSWSRASGTPPTTSTRRSPAGHASESWASLRATRCGDRRRALPWHALRPSRPCRGPAAVGRVIPSWDARSRGQGYVARRAVRHALASTTLSFGSHARAVTAHRGYALMIVAGVLSGDTAPGYA